MSPGEEKFYSPREDLENLKTSIDNLKTSIDTLILKMALPSETQHYEKWDTTETDTEYRTLANEILSATKNCYLVKLVIELTHPTQDPILARDSDLYITVIDEDGNMILSDNVVGMNNQFTNYGGFGWFLARHYHLNDQKLTANTKYQIVFWVCNMKTGLVVKTHTTYFEEYAI